MTGLNADQVVSTVCFNISRHIYTLHAIIKHLIEFSAVASQVTTNSRTPSSIELHTLLQTHAIQTAREDLGETRRCRKQTVDT